MAKPQPKPDVPAAASGPTRSSDWSTARMNAALREASYLTLYSMPDPEKADTLVRDNQFRAVAIHVNEELHRFPINLAAGTCVGERLANIHLEWRPVPEGFHHTFDEAPPETPLDPGVSQRFVIRNGNFSCRDQAKSYFHGVGGGRTYPTDVDGGQQLHLSGIVNVVETGGAFKGLEGTILTNGHIRPPEALSLLIVARFIDPEGTLRSAGLSDLEPGLNPDPDYASLVLLAEPDPEAPGTITADAQGNLSWEANEILRLVSLDCASGEAIRCTPIDASGPVVGRLTAKFTVNPDHANPEARVRTEEAIFRFADTKGKPVGTLGANLLNGYAFPARLPLGGSAVYRVGGNGPIQAAESTGIFAGARGMMALNGACTVSPVAGSGLHIFRIYDAGGSIRSQMRDAWDLKPVWQDTRIEPSEAALVNRAVESLAEGLELKAWWEKQHEAGSHFQERFELVKSAHPDDTSYGFFDEAPLRSGKLRVMGCYQRLLFDRPRSGMQNRRNNLREFVLNYFLRSMSFREPEAASGSEFGTIPSSLRGLSLNVDTTLRGLGFSQLYYKLVTGEIGRFAPEYQRVIVDQRQLGDPFEWIVLKANLHDFKLAVKPFGNAGPQLAFPMRQQTWLVTGPGFVVDREDEFGVGYSILRHDRSRLFLAYGPSEWEHGFGSIIFRIEQDETISVRMGFVVNRPDKIMNIPYDPVDLFFRAARSLTLGMSDRLTSAMDSVLPSFVSSRGLDPVQAYIAAANAITGGAAGQRFGLSLPQLERSFLVQHYVDHYRIIRNALMAYRSVPDWTADAPLPRSIRTGRPELE